MKIEEKLKSLVDYYNMSRAAGHTTNMMKGVLSSEKCILLTHDHRMTKHIKNNWDLGEGAVFVTSNTLENLRGNKLPLFIDNAALHMILEESLSEIESLEKQNTILKLKLESIREIVK